MTVISKTRDVTGGLIAMLEAATGRRVYDFAVPRADGDPLELQHPYGVLRPVGGNSYGGPPLVAPDVDVDLVYQVEGVSDARHRVEWMIDQAREALLGRDASGAFVRSINIGPGWAVNDRRPVPGTYGVDKSGRVYWAHERFRVFATPT